MTSKECEMQLTQLIIDWNEDKGTRLNKNDIEAFKHLLLKNQVQHDEIIKLQQENMKYKEVIDKAIEYIENKRIREKAIIDVDVLEGILKEVE